MGCRISPGQEGHEPITQWKGTVLDQVAVKASLHLLKCDGIDCVCGLEVNKDKRVLCLKILSDRVASSQSLTPAFLMPSLAKQWNMYLRVSMAMRVIGGAWSWAKLLSWMPAFI